MTFERTKNSTRTMLFGIINRIITILLPFVTRTIIIHKLGSEYAGLSSLFTSVLTVLNISELGISSAITFCLYEPVAKDRKDEVRALLGLFRKIYWIIGGVILAGGAVAMPFLKYLISADYPEDINLYLLFAIYLLNSAFSYFTSAYKTVIFNVYQRGDIAHNINSVAEIFKYAAQIVVLLVWSDYYLFVLILLISTMLINLLTGIISRRKYPELYPKGTVSKQTKDVIKNKTVYLAAHSVTAKLINAADNIIISSFIGLVAVGVYGNYNYISTSIIGLILIVYGAVRAPIGNSIHTESKETNLKIYNSLWLGSTWIATWCAISMLCLYQPFITLWVGAENLLPITTVIYIVLYFHANACNQFFTTTYIGIAGLWNKTLIRQIVAAVVNLGLNLLLGIYFGVAGVVFASFITTLLIVYPFDIFITYKYVLKESPKKGFAAAAINYLWFVLLGGGCYFLCEQLPFEGILNILLRAAVCVVVPNVIYYAAIRKTEEWRFLWDHAKSLIKR